jgi:hypothetical protein
MVHHLVTADLKNAWKQRMVYRTFAAEIKHDILANQPMNVLDRATEIVSNNMAQYLQNRMKKPLDMGG